jgi:Protein of unknown function (DUF2905)
MSDLANLGRVLIAVGAVVLLLGIVLVVADRVPFLDRLGRLPGDVLWRRGSTTVFVPIVTSLLLSVLLTIALNLIFRR